MPLRIRPNLQSRYPSQVRAAQSMARRPPRKPGINPQRGPRPVRAAASGSVPWMYPVFVTLLVLPAMALVSTGLNLPWVGLYALGVSVVTFWIYACDKRCARAGEWRIPEARLLFFDLIGGWPGGLLAQQTLRHKCSKQGYQATFWIIVLLWQGAAADCLLGWPVVRTIGTVVAAEERSYHGPQGFEAR